MSLIIERQQSVIRTRREFEEQLIHRASHDQEFRQELISQPAVALARELGISLPPEIQVEVVEETTNRFFIVLPPADTRPAAEGAATGVVRLLADTLGPMY